MKFENIIVERPNKAVYHDGVNCYKVFDAGYNKTAIFDEVANLVRVEETGLSVPKIRGVDNIDGRWVIVTEYIRGKTLEQLIAEHPEQKEAYFRILADLQSSTHKKDCPYLYRLKDELDQKIVNSELDATIRYDLHNRLEELAKGTAICHGDFWPSNIILSESGVYYTVDWALSSNGNPLADVAQTYIKLWMSDCYDDAELYLDLYCSESRVDKESIYEWLPIIGAAMTIRRLEDEKRILLDCVNSGDFKNQMKKYRYLYKEITL